MLTTPSRVADYEEYNQMTAEALAIVFSPNLLRTADFGLLLSNMGHSNKLVKALITHVRSYSTLLYSLASNSYANSSMPFLTNPTTLTRSQSFPF